MLLQQAIQVLYLGARTLGNTALARPLYRLRSTALIGRHRVDHRLHAGKHFRIQVLLCHLSHVSHAWQLVQHPGNTAHVVHLLELVAEVLQIKALAFLDLASQFGGFLLIDLLLCLFDQGEHVPHTENA